MPTPATTRATHTPGPWMVIKTHRGVPHVSGAGGMNGGLIARCDTNKPQAVNDANAWLLAAAPDLYGSVKAFLAAWNATPANVDEMNAALVAAEKACAKAEGKAE